MQNQQSVKKESFLQTLDECILSDVTFSASDECDKTVSSPLNTNMPRRTSNNLVVEDTDSVSSSSDEESDFLVLKNQIK